MLAIPYLRKHPEHGWFVVSIKFRRLGPGDPKYLFTSGEAAWLYNTPALIGHSPIVAITEGEIDAITAQLCGIPAVGVPGVQHWKPYYRELFLGYRDVYLLADGDEPGIEFAEKLKRQLPNAKIIQMGSGYDVNKLVIEKGPAALTNKLK